MTNYILHIYKLNKPLLWNPTHCTSFQAENNICNKWFLFLIQRSSAGQLNPGRDHHFRTHCVTKIPTVNYHGLPAGSWNLLLWGRGWMASGGGTLHQKEQSFTTNFVVLSGVSRVTSSSTRQVLDQRLMCQKFIKTREGGFSTKRKAQERKRDQKTVLSQP